MADKLLNRIDKRQKFLAEIQLLTDLELEDLTLEMAKDYQRIANLESEAENESKLQLRKIRKKIEKQQKALQQYQQIRYKKMVLKAMPPTPVFKNILNAFLVGGTICALGQLILNALTLNGFTDVQAAAGTSGLLIFLGALLTGLGLYDKIGKFAGAGSIVPITGFANSITSPALEFKKEGYIYGVGSRIFTIAGPVILYGTLVSIIVGLLFFITI